MILQWQFERTLSEIGMNEEQAHFWINRLVNMCYFVGMPTITRQNCVEFLSRVEHYERRVVPLILGLLDCDDTVISTTKEIVTKFIGLETQAEKLSRDQFLFKVAFRVAERKAQLNGFKIYGDHTCLRCGGAVPSFKNVGEYPGSLSRVDNKTEICAECGTNEAVESMRGNLSPKNRWVYTK